MLTAQVLLHLQYMAAAQSQPLQHVWLLHGNSTHSLSRSCCKALSKIILLGRSEPRQVFPMVMESRTAEFRMMTQRLTPVQERFDHHCAVCPTNLHTACIQFIGVLLPICEDHNPSIHSPAVSWMLPAHLSHCRWWATAWLRIIIDSLWPCSFSGSWAACC